MIKTYIYNILKGFLPKNSANRMALKSLRDAGFEMPEIRKALFVLNGITMKSLANGVSLSSLSNTVKGTRVNAHCQEILAAALDLEVIEIFPDAGPN